MTREREGGSEFPAPCESHTHTSINTQDSNSSRWPGDYSPSIPTPSPPDRPLELYLCPCHSSTVPPDCLLTWSVLTYSPYLWHQVVITFVNVHQAFILHYTGCSSRYWTPRCYLDMTNSPPACTAFTSHYGSIIYFISHSSLTQHTRKLFNTITVCIYSTANCHPEIAECGYWLSCQRLCPPILHSADIHSFLRTASRHAG